MNQDDQQNSRNTATARFAGWLAVGVLFMVGCIAPISFFDWIPAALLAGFLIWRGVRSPRYFFAFAAGIGITLVGLGIVNGTYRIMLLYGSVVIAGESSSTPPSAPVLRMRSRPAAREARAEPLLHRR